jgi:integrase
MYYRLLKDGSLVDRAGAKLPGIFPNRRADGSVASYTLRWRTPTGQRKPDGAPRYTQHSKSLKSADEIVALWEQAHNGASAPPSAPAAPEELLSLDELVGEWVTYTAQKATEKHMREMARLWDRHVHPFIGHRTVADVVADNGIFRRFQSDLQAGRKARRAQATVPALRDPASVRKVLYLVRGVMKHARREHPKSIPHDPTDGMFVMPSAQRERLPRPLPAIAVERIREAMLNRAAKVGVYPLRDATIVSVLAYGPAGRPSELLGATWDDLGEQTVLYQSSAAAGRTVRAQTKTTKRAARLLAPAAEDLFRWRLAVEERYGPQPGHGLIFQWLDPEVGPLWNRDGSPMAWPQAEWGRWGQRVWRPATKTAARSARELLWLPDAVPYDLRHTAVSLAIRSDAGALLRGQADGTRVDHGTVARWAGHTVEELSKTYQHVFDEYERLGVIDPVVLIEEARAQVADAPFVPDEPVESPQAAYQRPRRQRQRA